MRALLIVVALAVSGPAAAGAETASCAPSSADSLGSWLSDLGEVFARLDPSNHRYPFAGDRPAERARIAAIVTAPREALAPPDRSVFDSIAELGVDDVDLFHGSHVVAADQGRLYQAWKEGALPRISTHYSGVHDQQYERRFAGLGVLLFGKTRDGSTWFQLEAHSGTDPQSALFHIGDFLRYVFTGGDNVGPFGLSSRTETRKPIRVRG